MNDGCGERKTFGNGSFTCQYHDHRCGMHVYGPKYGREVALEWNGTGITRLWCGEVLTYTAKGLADAWDLSPSDFALGAELIDRAYDPLAPHMKSHVDGWPFRVVNDGS